MKPIPLQVTDKAKVYLKSVGKPNVSLAVRGGGCAGFAYELSLILI